MSMKPVRRASRMATGTSNVTATKASRKLPASRSSSGKSYLPRRSGLVSDHVVDGAINRVTWGPARGGLQERRLRAPVRDLLEAWLVSLLERDEANVGARLGRRYHAVCELEASNL